MRQTIGSEPDWKAKKGGQQLGVTLGLGIKCMASDYQSLLQKKVGVRTYDRINKDMAQWILASGGKCAEKNFAAKEIPISQSIQNY